MKLTFAEGFPGDVACGAIGAQAYNYERGEMPVEVGDVMGEALLRTTWRKRTETPVEGQEKPKVTYTDEPVFARVEELPVVEGEGQGELTVDPASEIPGVIEAAEAIAEGEQIGESGLPPTRRRAR